MSKSKVKNEEIIRVQNMFLSLLHKYGVKVQSMPTIQGVNMLGEYVTPIGGYHRVTIQITPEIAVVYVNDMYVKSTIFMKKYHLSKVTNASMFEEFLKKNLK